MVIAPIMCIGGSSSRSVRVRALAADRGRAALMTVFIGFVIHLVVPKFRTMQTKIDRINQVLREQITGVR